MGRKTAIDALLDRAPLAAAMETLAALPASELSSFGLELARRRAASRTPSEVLAQYRADRFVRPSRSDQRTLLAIERAAFSAVPARYQPIALAPVAPLGTVSSVAVASQHKIVSTLRGTEVVSDATNLLALECAERRRADPTGAPVALCASQRMVRAQALADPTHTAHFQLFVTVLAGRDPGGRTFFSEALEDAIAAQLALLGTLRDAGFLVAGMRATISPDARLAGAADRACEALGRRFPDVPVTVDGARIEKSRYYRDVCLGVFVRHEDGREFPIGDGGSTDWLAKLTGSRKERFFVGAIGIELLAALFAPLRG